MRTITTLLMLAGTLAFAQDQPAPQQNPKAAKEARLALVKKLQADLDTAGARAKFTDQQRQEFTAAQEALRKQGGRHRKGEKMDRTSVRQAMQTLRGLSSSEALAPEDREMLQKDLKDLRAASRARHGATTRKTAA